MDEVAREAEKKLLKSEFRNLKSHPKSTTRKRQRNARIEKLTRFGGGEKREMICKLGRECQKERLYENWVGGR